MLGIAQCRETHQRQLFLLACAWLHSWLSFPFLGANYSLCFLKKIYFVSCRAGSSSLHRLFLQLERVGYALVGCGPLVGSASLAAEQHGLSVCRLRSCGSQALDEILDLTLYM